MAGRDVVGSRGVFWRDFESCAGPFRQGGGRRNGALLMMAAGSFLIASGEADVGFNLVVHTLCTSWAVLTSAFSSMQFLSWAFVHWNV